MITDHTEHTAPFTVDASTTLADIVTGSPGLARDLQRLDLDYCCGGGRSLGAASVEHGLDPEVVVDALARAARSEPADVAEWAVMGAAQLVDHIESTHHRYLWDELPRLTELLDGIVAVHGDRHPELVAVARCYSELRDDMEPHLRKEELVLFPMIRELCTADTLTTSAVGAIAGPISVMLVEHDRVGELLFELRALPGGYAPPPDGCASFDACSRGLETLEADTHLHVHKENNVLFPAVAAIERRRRDGAST